MRPSLTDHDEYKHASHLCYLVKRRQMATETELSQDLAYVCGTYRSVAGSENMLCAPIWLGGDSLGDPRLLEGMEGPDAPPMGLIDHDEAAHDFHLRQMVENRLMARGAQSPRNGKFICSGCGRAAVGARSPWHPVGMWYGRDSLAVHVRVTGGHQAANRQIQRRSEGCEHA